VLTASRDARLKDEVIAGLRVGGRTGELQEKVISLTRKVNDMQNSIEDLEIERTERQKLLLELDMLREANRALEKKNEDLAASTIRARTALQDVEAAEKEAAGLRRELEETQRKLANARQTIVNLQGVNAEKVNVEAYTAVEDEMRTTTLKMQELEEDAASKEQHYQKIIGTLRANLEQEKAKSTQQMEALRTELGAHKHENSSLAKSVEHGKEAAAKAAMLEEELKKRQQHVLGLEGEIKRQRDLLNQTTQAQAASGQELGESKNIINALQDRVSFISAQLHDRTSELQNTKRELEEQREAFRMQRQETEVIWMCVCMYLMCVCMYVYTHTHIHTQVVISRARWVEGEGKGGV
jgi:chromosome segregation ATPase